MPLTTQLDVLCFTIDVLERLEIPYMVCGSMAAGALGEPRMTLDIDVVVQLSVSNAERLCAEFPSPEFYVSVAAARDAIRFGKQFNAIHPETGNKVDFMILGRDPWSRAQLERRCRVTLVPSLDGYSSSPEDIIISKMRYYREGQSDKHLRDSAGVLARQGDRIDRAYIEHWATEFGVSDVWQAIVQRVDTAMAGRATHP